jgi:hypothetical protein
VLSIIFLSVIFIMFVMYLVDKLMLIRFMTHVAVPIMQSYFANKGFLSARGCAMDSHA